MKYPSKIRLLGLIFIILSASGLLFSLAGIAATWIIGPRLNQNLVGLLDSFSETLSTTDNGLSVLENALQDSLNNLELVVHSLDDLGDTVADLSSSLDSSGELIGDDLRLTILNTQTALSSAATSAVLIDNTVKFIARLPIIGADYQPDVPLHTSLEQVAGSLEDVPESLEEIEQNLNDTADGLDALRLDLDILGENIASMDEDLENAQEVVMDYRDIITNVQQKTDELHSHFPSYMIIAGLTLSALFFWLGTALLNVLIQGIKYWQGEQHVVNLAELQRE